MVPNAGSVIYSDCGGELVKKKSPSCGKQKQVILKQLLELLADGGGGDGGGDDVEPRTPCSGGGWQPENLCEEQLQEEKQLEDGGGGGFTSLLMMQPSASLKEEVNSLWNNSSTCDHSAQIWDFNLGQLRGHDEPGSIDLECGGSDMVYTVKSYSELLKETSLEKRGANYSIAHEDIIPFNCTSNNQGPATSESNSLPVSKPSSYSDFTKTKSFGGSIDLQFADQPILMNSENVMAMTKADMDLLAKNRGNAMQRYKEKKKNRR
ncbi:zinc finger protein constans-like 14 [Phtheirospermum japonicum]|uniref:Zinc finger protein constans-like 14 n=1 Tax=Phtheirospermum japonicum TaxID=374723 RepID=A0A830CEW1_9LAMI|nr:zinc finger protein constans-like 14 [Phtheirospermum japonicum]